MFSDLSQPKSTPEVGDFESVLPKIHGLHGGRGLYLNKNLEVLRKNGTWMLKNNG